MNEKDIKLLWGRGANRCTICHTELSQDRKSATASFTLGEQAHIVGEKEDAPRGKSPLTIDERNSYHNLILLCPNHHTEIDKNEADWPVEKLHYVKSVHELWVRETLGDSTDARLLAKQVAVTSIIDLAVQHCCLENWKTWTYYALKTDPIWDADMPEKLFEFRQRVAAGIWPEEYEELRRATTTLAILLDRAASKFLQHATFNFGKYHADRFYKRFPNNPNYHRELACYEEWGHVCEQLMVQATCAANWFADVVRRDINPMFFIERGRFLVFNSTDVPEYSADQKSNLPASLISEEP
jgi:hypothetical protein